jgi:hypothetical protein
MGWVRLDDTMPHHPKILAVGHRGAWLFTSAVCWSNRYLTDGFIPDTALPMLTDIPNVRELADRLTEVGLFDRTESGFLIHDYHEYQPSSAKVKASREDAKARMESRRSPDVRANNSRTIREQSQNIERTSRNVQPPQTQTQTQTQTQRRKRSSASSMQDREADALFDSFWSTYPVKKGKAAARKAWAKIAPDEELAARITASVRHQARGWSDPKYIPHPTRWLSEARWEDETIILPTTGNAVANPFVALLEEEDRCDESTGSDTDSGSFAVEISPDENW